MQVWYNSRYGVCMRLEVSWQLSSSIFLFHFMHFGNSFLQVVWRNFATACEINSVTVALCFHLRPTFEISTTWTNDPDNYSHIIHTVMKMIIHTVMKMRWHSQPWRCGHIAVKHCPFPMTGSTRVWVYSNGLNPHALVIILTQSSRWSK